MKYKIKDSVKLFKKNNIYSILFMNKHLEIKLEADKLLLEILNLIDSSFTTDEIYQKLKSKYSYITLEELESIIFELTRLGLLEKDTDLKIDDKELLFLNRHLNFLSDYTNDQYNKYQLQERLFSASIVIIGVGAIGSWIAYNLIQSGIKNLILIDPDKVSLSNLSRQSLYFKEDIGKFKVNVLKKHLEKIVSNLNITIHKKEIQEKDDLNIINFNVDLVINCSDKPDAYTTGAIVSEYCIPRKIPNINGIGYRGNICSLGLTNIPYKSICWKCLHHTNYQMVNRGSQLKFNNHNPTAGSTSSIATLIASIHSWEAIKVLIPTMTPSLINKQGKFNFDNLRIDLKPLKNIQKCEICLQKKECNYE